MKILSKTEYGYIVEISQSEIEIICSDYDAKYQWMIGKEVNLDLTLKKLKDFLISNENLNDSIHTILSLAKRLDDSKHIIFGVREKVISLLELNRAKPNDIPTELLEE